MPIYEYYCATCKQVFELKRPMSEMSDPAPCLKCGKGGQRLMSVFGATNNTSGRWVRPPTGEI
ncbi:FmdB family zinc ribbon protein [Chloroflexota bacterium]